MIIAENDMTMIVIKKVSYAFFVLILWIIFAFFFIVFVRRCVVLPNVYASRAAC